MKPSLSPDQLTDRTEKRLKKAHEIQQANEQGKRWCR